MRGGVGGVGSDTCVADMSLSIRTHEHAPYLGGRSPESQTPGDPASPALDDEELFVIEGSQLL